MKAKSSMLLKTLPALLLLGACSSDRSNGGNATPAGPIAIPSVLSGTAPPPSQVAEPEPPEGVSVPAGTRSFSLDTSVPNVPLEAHGLPTGVSLNARLASAGGQREIQLLDAAGRVETVAAGDWNLPAVAAADARGRVLVCWNRLTGPEPAVGATPHPSAGLSLQCRLRVGGTYSDELGVGAAGVPCWLKDVTTTDASTFSIRYFKNKSGWLFGPAADGDGVFTRTFDGDTLSDPIAD